MENSYANQANQQRAYTTDKPQEMELPALEKRLTARIIELRQINETLTTACANIFGGGGAGSNTKDGAQPIPAGMLGSLRSALDQLETEVVRASSLANRLSNLA